jgi:hypothetical protein
VPSHESIRQMIRRRLVDRTLPRATPSRIWGGPGLGLTCGVCELPVTADQSELQVELFDGYEAPMLEVLHLHTVCFALWELERTDGHGPLTGG